MDSSLTEDNISKAIAVLKHNDDKMNLISKIDYLENKGVSATDILKSIKTVSSNGLLQLKTVGINHSSKYQLFNKALPWITVFCVGLATYYLTEDSDDEDDSVSILSIINLIINKIIMSHCTYRII